MVKEYSYIHSVYQKKLDKQLKFQSDELSSEVEDLKQQRLSVITKIKKINTNMTCDIKSVYER